MLGVSQISKLVMYYIHDMPYLLHDEKNYLKKAFNVAC